MGVISRDDDRICTTIILMTQLQISAVAWESLICSGFKVHMIITSERSFLEIKSMLFTQVRRRVYPHYPTPFLCLCHGNVKKASPSTECKTYQTAIFFSSIGVAISSAQSPAGLSGDLIFSFSTTVDDSGALASVEDVAVVSV